MVLLIDNYDSFTYNLYDYIKQLGFDCKVFRNDEISILEINAIENLEAIVLSPGPGIPKNAGIMPEVLAQFYDKIPILGICLGHQAIGEFFGAKLVKANKPMHGKTSEIIPKKHFLFNGIIGDFEVMRYHSLLLENVSKPLEIIAETKSKEVMAIAHHSLPIIGIQFHPESILTKNGLIMIQNFLSHCKIN